MSRQLSLAWMQRGFEGGWLGPTFSKAVFFGNGLMAIVAGLTAHLLVETLAFGPVAPFDAAATVMVVGGAIIVSTWTENFGDASERHSFIGQCTKAAQAIARGRQCSAVPPTSPSSSADVLLVFLFCIQPDALRACRRQSFCERLSSMSPCMSTDCWPRAGQPCTCSNALLIVTHLLLCRPQGGPAGGNAVPV